MGLLGSFFLALALPSFSWSAQQEQNLPPGELHPPTRSTGLDSVEKPQVAVIGSTTLRVVSGKAAFTVAGPAGSTFQFQPSVPHGPSFQTASIQVNGVDVAVGRFADGLAPALGFSPTDSNEVVVYRGVADGKAQTLATYNVRTDGHELHSLKLKVDGGKLVPAEKKDGSFLVFGPSGAIGITSQRPFSVDLSTFPSGPTSFETVYVHGDYAESPVVFDTTLDARIGIDGLGQPFGLGEAVKFHVTDPLQKGIKAVRVFLNGKRLGVFDDWKTSISLDLSSYRPGIYRLSVVGELSDGTTIGPENRMLELTERSPMRKPVQTTPTIRDIVIQAAWYGEPGGQGTYVTDKVAARLALGFTTFEAANNVFGDTASGLRKVLVIQYTVRGKVQTKSIPENETMDLLDAPPLPESPAANNITVVSATYEGVDVTAKVRSTVAGGDTMIRVDPSWLGVPDPAPGVHKTLTIVVVDPDGTSRVCSGTDGDMVSVASRIAPMLDGITNASFDTLNVSSFVSDMKYVPAGNGVLAPEGMFTIAGGVMRPFQLHPSLRLDFMQHSSSSNSMAMFIHPKPGRQPMLLWSEKVKVVPNTNYEFKCYCADISEDNASSWASIVLDVDGIRSPPIVLESADEWLRIWLYLRTTSRPYATISIWRDVLPAFAESPSLIGIDDITFHPTGKG